MMLKHLTRLTDYKSDREIFVDLRQVSSLTRLPAVTIKAYGVKSEHECPDRTRVAIGSFDSVLRGYVDVFLVAETPAEIAALDKQADRS